MKECTTCRTCFPDHINYCPLDGHQTLQSIAGEPILDGRYQLEMRLGQGGMGVVYKAHHVFLKTNHAIKVILPDLVGNDPSLATRFRQEAMAAAAIRHPNIIAVTDYGLINGIMPFLVMEFIPGRSLHDLLEAEGKFSAARALEVMTVVAAGVGAAHQRGIVHRDLKPLNIMIEDDKPLAEAIKILDFGLAKIKSGDLLGSFLVAQTTGMIGSPLYMAPEQWSDEEPDRRADIYSLGIVLYQMLAGNVPFEGTAVPTIMKKHLMTPPPPFTAFGVVVPPRVERVVRHALEKDPQQRPSTVDEFIRELRAAVMGTDRAPRLRSPEADLEDITKQEEKEFRKAKEEAARLRAAEDARKREEEKARLLAEAEAARKREEEEARRKAEEAARLRAAEEARKREEEEARRRAEAAARFRAAEEARMLEEARLLAEVQAARKREEEAARRKAEEAERLRAAEEARKREEEKARLLAEAEAARKREEEEARRKAEEAARLRAAEEARMREEEKARLLAEAEAARKREEEAARRKAEEAARLRAAEEARKREEEEARLLAEAEAERQREEEEARRAAEEEAERLRAEEARKQEEEEARLLAEAEAARKREEEEARRAAEEEVERLRVAEEARKREEEEARLLAEAEAARKWEGEGATLQLSAEEVEEFKRREEAQKASRQAEEAARQEAEEDAQWQRVEDDARHRSQEEAARWNAQEEARLKAEQEAIRPTKKESRKRGAKKAARSEPEPEPEQLPATVVSGDFMEQTIAPQPTSPQPVAETLYQAVSPPVNELERGGANVRDTMVSNYPPPVSQQVQAVPHQTFDVSQVPSFGSAAPALDLPAPKKSLLPIYIGIAVLVVLLGGGGGLFLLLKKGSEPTPQTNGSGTPTSGATTGEPKSQPGAPQVPQREMVSIPGGSFQMGRDDGPDNEKPAHSETVKPFYIDKTEVTNSQYAEYVQATKYPAPSNDEGEKPYWKPWEGDKPPAGQESWPVRNVSANEALAYAAWLSSRDHVKYRLPTEQEWEYVARNGGSTRLFPWGNDWKNGYANIDSDLPKSVGSYKEGATRTGVLDMIGNVWEWTSSKATYYPGSQITNSGAEKQVVIRGGSYQSKARGEKAITATWRLWVDRNKHPTIGFRLVRDAP